MSITKQNSLLATIASVIPCCVAVFLRPEPRRFVMGLANCAWGFFLFSFQVHEKSVLLPLMPSSLLLFTDPEHRSWVGYINIVATFSLWPLLKKDGLQMQYFVLTTFWIWLGSFWRLPANRFFRTIHVFTYSAILGMHVLEPLVAIEGKPDLWVVGNVLLCCGCYGVFYLWSLMHVIKG